MNEEELVDQEALGIAHEVKEMPMATADELSKDEKSEETEKSEKLEKSEETEE